MNNNNDEKVVLESEAKSPHDEWRVFNTIVFVLVVVAVYWFLVIRPRLPSTKKQAQDED